MILGYFFNQNTCQTPGEKIIILDDFLSFASKTFSSDFSIKISDLSESLNVKTLDHLSKYSETVLTSASTGFWKKGVFL